MAKLNQIIAVEKGIKSRTHSEFSDLYKVVQKPALFNGFAKTYQANDDNGDTFPDERQRVQYQVNNLLQTAATSLTELFTITARKDWTNTVAKASVTLPDGAVLFADAPVSFLLFVEKQLTDFRTFVAALPVLDEAEDWTIDPSSGLNKSDTIKTHKQKKVQKAIVLYPATPEHPAQTQLITEDVNVGYWSQIKFSGATSTPFKEALLTKVETLLNAIKTARETANLQEEYEITPSVGNAIFGYLLG